jgi:hypothetical protein
MIAKTDLGELAPENPGLELYNQPPSFTFSATLDGRGMAALAKVLKDPELVGSRSRKHRRYSSR